MGALERSRQDTAWAAVRSDAQLLAATATGCSSSPVRVLDFGGGMGIGYVMLRSASPHCAVSYTVIEGARVCEEGRRLVPDVQFVTTIPDAAFDIVLAASSLQYIDDHAALLSSLVGSSPALILADVPAGKIRTFWSGQLTVSGSTIAYKFMNLDEVVATVETLGFKLCARGVAERPIDTSSLPPEYRIERTCNLLFRR
jgi:putative methyltransferase (TIGR04325 family)